MLNTHDIKISFVQIKRALDLKSFDKNEEKNWIYTKGHWGCLNKAYAIHKWP
jgi:hypothetical protein